MKYQFYPMQNQNGIVAVIEEIDKDRGLILLANGIDSFYQEEINAKPKLLKDRWKRVFGLNELPKRNERQGLFQGPYDSAKIKFVYAGEENIPYNDNGIRRIKYQIKCRVSILGDRPHNERDKISEFLKGYFEQMEPSVARYRPAAYATQAISQPNHSRTAGTRN